MEVFSIGGMLPLLVIFAVAIYSVAMVGYSLVRRLSDGTFSVEPEGMRQPLQRGKLTLSGKVAVALSGIALASEIVLMTVIFGGFPESIRASFFMALFPVLTLGAIGGVVVGSLSRGKWNLVGVAMGMVVLVSLSIWLLTPVIFPK